MLPTAALDPLLRRLRHGPLSGRALHEALGCSADALGRLLRAHPDRFVRLGARKTSTYALIRPIPGVPQRRNLYGVSFAVANMTGLIARQGRAGLVRWMPAGARAEAG